MSEHPRPAPVARQNTIMAACLATAFVVLCLAGAPAFAGTIHPALQEELARLAPDAQTRAIFVLERQADIENLNQALKIQRATRQERHRQVISALQQAAREGQAALVAELSRQQAAGQVAEYRTYWINNMVILRGTRQAIENLAGRADVATVEPGFSVSLMEPIRDAGAAASDGTSRGIGVTPGLRAIHAPQVWYELGVTGEGALVANLDTGVDGDHPALETRWRGYQGQEPWQECWLDVLGTNTHFPEDNYGHGTHVMGTITGLGAGTQDTVGVAWGAKWIAANAINQGVGAAFDQDVLDCLEWIADPDGNPNTIDDVPDVCQHSWRINEGFGGNYTDCDVRWWAAIDNAEAAGVVQTWSAGNEGPGAQTIGSPPDRATTVYNVFSVGAVDATAYNWPYPIAGFSSRGPTGCNVPEDRRIKPEVVAPGVDVYSSVPGGGYQSGWSGTSMAGPHVAGVVGLMRAVAPDMDVETIKQIIMDTCRDEGTAGEDNTYGWGFIDAYEAVLRSMTGYGTLQGTVTNASGGGNPVDGAVIRLVETDRTFVSANDGTYRGMHPQGTYTVEATHPSFATQLVPGVVITENQVTTLDFAMDDVGGPDITNVAYPPTVYNPDGNIGVTASATDYTGVASMELVWRVNGGDWTNTNMNTTPGGYRGVIPGQPIGSTIEFYIHGVDVVGNDGFAPPDAPNTLYRILVVLAFFVDDGESEQNWILSQPNDAQNGRWLRMDPLGTEYGGTQCEPADDHTPAPGTRCFVTGTGNTVWSSDVDQGCVTLTSPAVDLSGAAHAFLNYWRWFCNITPGTGGSFEALVSGNNGNSWVSLENFEQNANAWVFKTHSLDGLIPFSNTVRVRFIVCDTGADNIIEGAVDDVVFEGTPIISGVAPLAGSEDFQLFDNQPNPFSRETTISYRLARSGSVTLSVFDPSGRRVRTLASGEAGAGMHSVVWNGADDTGRPVSAGMYFYELQTDDGRTQRKMLLLK